MAKLDRLPSLRIIRTLKGSLDFYVFRGIPCVRRWPRNQHAGFTDGSRRTHSYFRLATQLPSRYPPAIREALQAQAGGSQRTWRDVATAAYYTSRYSHKEDPSPLPWDPPVPQAPLPPPYTHRGGQRGTPERDSGGGGKSV